VTAPAGAADTTGPAGAAAAANAFPGPGFADPARDAQRAFRAVLDALSHPTRRYPLTGPAEPPAALGRGLAAIALALLDEDCGVWLGGALGRDTEVASWLAFHTGARRADSTAAGFVIADPGTLPPLDSLVLGTDEAPHLSATVVLDVRGCTGTTRFTACGPGIADTATLAAPWAPDDLGDAWRRNTGLFPRGVDLLLVAADSVTAVPRTTRLIAADLEAAEPEAAEPEQEG
jgi:alpha-D-ribose 1-methylphosphonate 5-triphosphate synthase subunit PhnH